MASSGVGFVVDIRLMEAVTAVMYGHIWPNVFHGTSANACGHH